MEKSWLRNAPIPNWRFAYFRRIHSFSASSNAWLAKSQIQSHSEAIGINAGPALRNLDPPKANVYVVDAHAARPATGACSPICSSAARSRLMVVGERTAIKTSFSMLRLGVKGIVDLRRGAGPTRSRMPLVAAGGFWVPRSVLSVSWTQSSAAGPSPEDDSVTNLSPASRKSWTRCWENPPTRNRQQTHIAERTVKFHVSNLLSKFGVRAADLICSLFSAACPRECSVDNLTHTPIKLVQSENLKRMMHHSACTPSFT